MKKWIAIVMCCVLIISITSACTKQTDEKTNQTEEKTTTQQQAQQKAVKVGMVTDSGSVDDGRFNQMTWQGIEKACDELSIEYIYEEPQDTEYQSYYDAISNLAEEGCNIIIVPGYGFTSVIAKVQYDYTDISFVILDGVPINEQSQQEDIAQNTLAVNFHTEQAGFLAGVATALEIGSGELGFIGGIPITAVQYFNWGFQQGVIYANENCDTYCSMTQENWVYQGTFFDADEGQRIAAEMYDRGVKVIFCVAGAVGQGAFNEAMARATEGNEVYAIGVDTDQYQSGIYKDGKSIFLTSAIKRYDVAAYDAIVAFYNDEFWGGQNIYSLSGIPASNPNLSQETQDIIDQLSQKILSGEIVVADTQGDLLE